MRNKFGNSVQLLSILLLTLLLTQVSYAQVNALEVDFLVLGVVYGGSEIVILNNLTNNGPQPVRITSLVDRVYMSQRPYEMDYRPSGLPLNLSAGENKILNVTANIPFAYNGRITLWVYFQNRNATSQSWTASVELVTISKTVHAQDSFTQFIVNLWRFFPIIIGLVALVGIVISALLIRHEERKRISPEESRFARGMVGQQ